MKLKIEEVIEQGELKMKKRDAFFKKYFLEGFTYVLLLYNSFIIFSLHNNIRGYIEKQDLLNSFIAFCIYGILITIISFLFNRKKNFEEKFKSLGYTIVVIFMLNIPILIFPIIAIGTYGWLFASYWLLEIVGHTNMILFNGQALVMIMWPIMFMILGRLISEIKMFKGKEKGENDVSNKV